ncbi:MAG: HU family DNA-binding protein [Ignavibacteria bacterium]
MNTIDLINKLSIEHNITTGRAEMILSIIVDRLIEKLKKEGEVQIENFGTFSIQQKKAEVSSFLKLSEPIQLAKNLITFLPDRVFLERINR